MTERHRTALLTACAFARGFLKAADAEAQGGPSAPRQEAQDEREAALRQLRKYDEQAYQAVMQEWGKEVFANETLVKFNEHIVPRMKELGRPFKTYAAKVAKIRGYNHNKKTGLYEAIFPEPYNPDINRPSTLAYPCTHHPGDLDGAAIGRMKTFYNLNQNLTEAERKQVAEACRELHTLGSGLVCDRPEREHPGAAVDRAIRAMDARPEERWPR